MKSMLVVRVDRCLSCKSCEMACAVEHSESRELFSAIRENPAPRARVTVEQGAGFVVPLQCRQCEDAPCVNVCPTKALFRIDKDSPVIIDRELCIGCKMCVLVCPFGVIQFDEKHGAIIKCDQCFERVKGGGLPACVVACPTGALAYKTQDEVLTEKRTASLVLIERALTEEKK